MKKLRIAVTLTSLASCTIRPTPDADTLISRGMPSAAAQALNSPKDAILYSRDVNIPRRPNSAPTPAADLLDGSPILGEIYLNKQDAATVAAAYRNATLNWHPIAHTWVCACVFYPHFALHVISNSHSFDFFGYDTGIVDVVEDGKHIATVPAVGPVEPLLKPLQAANVTLPYPYSPEYTAVSRR